MIASVLLLNMSSALANGAPNGRHKHDTIVTFTKWVTAVVPPIPAEAAASRFLMAGIVGGDVAGAFVGEVLDRSVSTTGHFARRRRSSRWKRATRIGRH